jgi:DNA polymerase-3 subunit delta'
LLLTENAEKLLPTVRSRCMELPLLPLSEEILTAQLRSHFPQADEETIAAAIARSGGYLGQAAQVLEEGQTTSAQTEDFAAAFAASDSLALTLLLASMERWKRDQLIPVLQQWEALLQNALVCRSGIAATSSAARQLAAQRSSQELMHAIGQIQKAIAYAQGNVSEAAICGFLTWSLR